MPRPLLPKMIQNPRIQPIATAGRWINEQGNDFLANLAASLTSDDADRAGHPEILSIPDPWASATVLSDAFTYDQHHKHAACQRQWRGLLATIALAPQRRWPLQVRSMALSTAATAQPRSFAAVAHRMAPAISAFAGQGWDEVGLITMREQVLGLMVPSTFVCPVRSVGEGVSGILPWLKNGELHDPCHCDELNATDFTLLCKTIGEWRQLWQSLAASMTLTQTGQAVMGELSRFHDELRGKSTDAGVRFGANQTNANFSPPPGKVYNVFNTRWTLDDTGDPTGETVLPLREPYSRTFKSACLFDPAMARSAESRHRRVWAGRTVAEIHRAGDCPALAKAMAASGHMLITPDDLFMPGDTIHRLDYPARWQSAEKQQNDTQQNYLLPLTPLALLLFTPEELARRVRIDDSNGPVRVELHLDLTDSRQGARQRHCISRTYRDTASSKTQGNVLLWPDFKADHWPIHYGVVLTLAAEILRPAAFVNPDDVIGWLSSASRDEVFPSASSLASTLARLQTDANRWSSDKSLQLVRMTSAPEAVLFLSPGGPPSSLPTSWEANGSYTGLALINQNKVETNPDAEWTIGVDFGSSNTAAYHKTGNDDQPRPLTFNSRLDQIFTLTEQREAERSEITGDALFPSGTIAMPFQSLLAIRTPGVWRSSPMLSHYVRYVSGFGWIASIKSTTASKALDGVPLANLKWLEGERGPMLRSLFLSQVVMQALAEAAAQKTPSDRIQWRFSYPEALGETRFGNFCDEVIPSALTAGGLLPKRSEPVSLRTESACTLLYFHHREQIHLMGSSLFLDIGGETTDIFLWQGKPVWRSSLRLAGHHLLTGFLRRNRAFLEQLDGDVANRAKRAAPLFDLCGNDPSHPSLGTLLEMLVNNCDFSEEFLVKARRSLAQDPAVKRLTFISVLGLLGIFQYIGTAIRSFATMDPPTFRVDGGDGNRLRVFLGGRASRLFRVMIPEPMEDKAREFLKTSAGLQLGISRLSYSQEPKAEAAYGLLVDTDVVRDVDRMKTPLVNFLGLPITVGEKSVTEQGIPEDLKGEQGRTALMANPDRLRELFNMANTVAGTSFTLSEADWYEVFGHVKDRLSAIISLVDEGGALSNVDVNTVQPPFISGLAALIDRVVRQDGSGR